MLNCDVRSVLNSCWVFFDIHKYQPWPSLAPSVFLQPDQGREEEPAVPGKVSSWCMGAILVTGMGGAIAVTTGIILMGGTAPERSLQGAEKTWQAVQVG